MDLYGASMTLGYATSNFDLTVGLNGSAGLGKAQIRIDNPMIQDMDGYTLQLFVSGSFH